MKIAIVAPSPVPFTRGGAERAIAGLHAAINDRTHHEAELIKLPSAERTLPEVLASYEAFAGLDLDHFDRVIATKYPAWMVDHPHKTLYLFHPLRGLYDTYHLLGQPTTVSDPADHTFAMMHLMRQAHHRGALDEFFERWHNALDDLGPDHPDFAFPGPFARLCVRWLDSVATAPGAVKQYLSLSWTVADREGYFPKGVTPAVAYLPADIPAAQPTAAKGSYLFTASRLDGPKRLDLLVDAMAHVPGDIELRIAGTGPQHDALVERAAGDRRIRFLGFTPEEDLAGLYADALAVPFVPLDEDYGLITLEAFAQGTPVVTCTDAGGPAELVKDGVTGLVVPPDPAAIGGALASLVDDPVLAEKLGAAGRERGARITWDGVIDAVLGEERYTAEEQARRAEAADRAADAAAAAASPDRVVVLTTFAVDEPGHGGQIRARHLYGSLAAHRPVEVVALVDFGHQPGYHQLAPHLTQVVVPRSADHMELAEELSLDLRTPVSDLVAGSHIELTPAYLQAVARACRGASAVILAEPYLEPVIERLGLELPVLYDAYNVEAQLKADVYPASPLGRKLLDQVVDVERRAVRRAQRITTCSMEDARALAVESGRGDDAFAVVPNGTTIPAAVPTPAERRRRGARWRERYWTAGSMDARPEHVAVFFGSWHPPNLDAAELLMEVAAEAPEVLVLAVGRHGEAFAHHPVPDNLVFTGMVSARAKDSLLAMADVALNPMRIGSGTNLKLLEYLAAGVPVLSTPFGARGIEVIDGEHLQFADPADFAAALRALLADPDGAARRAAAGRALAAERYSWDALGAQLAGLVSSLVTP